MFADVEDSIVTRLRAKVPPGTRVETVAELDLIPQLVNLAPAVFVCYAGFDVAAAAGGQASQMQGVDLRFVLVVVTRNSSGSGLSKAARDESAALAITVLEALIGHPVGGGKYLRLVPAGGAEYDEGYAYLPLGFNCLRSFARKP